MTEHRNKKMNFTSGIETYLKLTKMQNNFRNCESQERMKK